MLFLPWNGHRRCFSAISKVPSVMNSEFWHFWIQIMCEFSLLNTTGVSCTAGSAFGLPSCAPLSLPSSFPPKFWCHKPANSKAALQGGFWAALQMKAPILGHRIWHRSFAIVNLKREKIYASIQKKEERGSWNSRFRLLLPFVYVPWEVRRKTAVSTVPQFKGNVNIQAERLVIKSQCACSHACLI